MMPTAAMLMTLLVAGPQDFDRSSADPNVIEITKAIVVAKGDRAVPALDAGLISQLLVSEGHYVTKGQMLARQDDKDLRAQYRARALELDLTIMQADSDVEERAAVETARTAVIEHLESLEINREEPGAVPATQVRRQELQASRAKLQAEVAREERKVAIMQTHVKAAEVEVTRIAIERRKILAPISGVVVQIVSREGEWLQPGEMLLRIQRMDVLRVEGLMSAKDASPYEVEGRPVKVVVQSPRGDIDTTGTIVFANPTFSGPDLNFRVVAEVNNKPHPTIKNVWQINPGMPATITLDRNAPRVDTDALAAPPVAPAAPEGLPAPAPEGLPMPAPEAPPAGVEGLPAAPPVDALPPVFPAR